MIPKLHQEFIDQMIPVLDSRIMGLAAGGSFINGDMDEFSDIDLVLVVNPDFLEQVMNERIDIATTLGNLLSAFTGEHVGEPRLLICLYGPPLLHVDLKFVSLEDIDHRVENPIILWEREKAVSERLNRGKAEWPMLDLQWIEDRFWVWIHYGATKIGRREIFEAIEFISFLRQAVLGPLILMKKGKLPRGVRKIEFDAPDYIPLLIQTIPDHDTQSCIKALKVIIQLYIELREHLEIPGLIKRSQAEKYVQEYLNQIT
ncbi:MAG: nucleotidyltransferase domain-containing protein [Chitinophagales bacterium]